MPETYSHRTPLGRIKRSAVQAAVGVIPATLALLNEGPSLARAAKYGGTSVASVLLIAVIQNVAEWKGWVTPR